MQITKKRTTRVFVSTLLLMAILMALLPSITANAQAQRRVFRATVSNQPSISMEVPNIVLFRGEMVFTLSGVPAGAQITSIEVVRNTPNTSGGATIVPHTWTLQRVTGAPPGGPSIVNIPASQMNHPINGFNGQNPNGVYALRFYADIFRGAGFAGMFGSRSYTNLRVYINFST